MGEIRIMPKLTEELKNAINDNSFKNQQDIAKWFKKKGRNINQSSISRALQKINALKRINIHGEIEYKIPTDYNNKNALENLSFLIKEIANNEVMIVVKTESGSASVISELIDKQHNEKILSTLAGENTVLIIPVSVKFINDIVSDLDNLIYHWEDKKSEDK